MVNLLSCARTEILKKEKEKKKKPRLPAEVKMYMKPRPKAEVHVHRKAWTTGREVQVYRKA